MKRVIIHLLMKIIIYSSSPDSDTGEDSDPSEDISDDEAQQDIGANVVSQPLTNITGQTSNGVSEWRPIQSSPRSFPFTVEEKLAVIPQTDASGINPIDIQWTTS